MSTKRELVNIIDELETLFQYNAFGLVNDLLSKATKKITVMDPDKMLTYARTTFRFNSELPAWNNFVDSIQAELVRRNLNVDELLQGLI